MFSLILGVTAIMTKRPPTATLPGTMRQPIRSLEDLRREIDEADDAIHDLVMRRTDLVAEIAAVKATRHDGVSGRFLRPGREARVIRRLLARHRGAFPKAALVRLWRELITAPHAVQGALSVAVYAPEAEPGYWDLARDHYGSHTPFASHQSPGQVVAALVEGSAIVGVLPFIQDGEPDPWWPMLARDDPRAPVIMARLPLAAARNARGEALGALVIGPVASEPTGRDHSYLALETDEEMSRVRLGAELARVGLEPCLFAFWAEPDGARRRYLVEVCDFVSVGDARLAKFRAAVGKELRRIFFLGSYAVPFSPAELASEPQG
jgi:chorismate mutase / prephenate dehydratase